MKPAGGRAGESLGFHSDLSPPKADNGPCHQEDDFGVGEAQPRRGQPGPSNLGSMTPAGGSGHILGARDRDARWAAALPLAVPPPPPPKDAKAVIRIRTVSRDLSEVTGSIGW